MLFCRSCAFCLCLFHPYPCKFAQAVCLDCCQVLLHIPVTKHPPSPSLTVKCFNAWMFSPLILCLVSHVRFDKYPQPRIRTLRSPNTSRLFRGEDYPSPAQQEQGETASAATNTPHLTPPCLCVSWGFLASWSGGLRLRWWTVHLSPEIHTLTLN